jgi:hypothetical protein
MQPQIMTSLGGFFVLIYLACVVAVIIYVLRLLGRFVSAHERVASSLDIIARKMRDHAKPRELLVRPPVLRFGAAAFAFTAFNRRLVGDEGFEPPTVSV